jgi:cell division protein ZapE
MDSFYSCVPVVRKTRLHFHEFMREVHRELEELRGRPTRSTSWPSASRGASG